MSKIFCIDLTIEEYNRLDFAELSGIIQTDDITEVLFPNYDDFKYRVWFGTESQADKALNMLKNEVKNI